MFVLKSTHKLAQRDMLAMAGDRDRLEALLDSAELQIAALRAELATTYVHDAKGRIARHPTYTPSAGRGAAIHGVGLEANMLYGVSEAARRILSRDAK